MANVTARGKFFDDPRFEVLGQLLGIEGDLARMKMMRLWSWQTEQHKGDPTGGVVDELDLIGRFGPGGPAALSRAKLAREVEPGRFYVCGSSGDDEGKSDLGWLARKRSAGSKGGSATSEARRSGQNRSTSAAPAQHTDSTAQARRHPQDPVSGTQDPDICPPSPPAGDPSAPDDDVPCRAPAAPASPHLQLVDRAVVRLDAARAELDPTSRPIGLHGDRPGRLSLLDRLAECGADASAALEHGVDVLIVEARDKHDVSLLGLGLLGSPKGWARLQRGTVASAKARGDPPAPRSRPAGRHTAAAELRDLATDEPPDPRDRP